jgi:hypothetical protein
MTPGITQLNFAVSRASANVFVSISVRIKYVAIALATIPINPIRQCLKIVKMNLIPNSFSQDATLYHEINR